MRKVLVSILVISLVSIPFFNSVNSSNTICNNRDSEKLLGRNFKDYRNCRIRNTQDVVDGIAYLFPGYFSGGGGNVNRAFGILASREAIMLFRLYFNEDYYFSNWSFAIIFSFDGYFQNFWEGPYRIFEIDGTAKFVRLYF